MRHQHDPARHSRSRIDPHHLHHHTGHRIQPAHSRPRRHPHDLLQPGLALAGRIHPRHQPRPVHRP
ncbi:hypothetical protein, partial [Streptomyces griseoviridis]|uniref:hypothetical protein n=1 Tax=Streptomyces griseoviridis TaxID=45398 RepID=UPI001E4C1728